jgi:hypothetical protein
MHSGWNLATITVLNKASGFKGTYNHHGWIPMGGGSVTLSEALCVQVRGGRAQHISRPGYSVAGRGIFVLAQCRLH